jgi:hypothetical protein
MVLLDLRTIDPADDAILAEALVRALTGDRPPSPP